MPIKTLYKWRQEGTGPCSVRVGRHVRYFVCDVRDWLSQQRGLDQTGRAPTRRGDPSWVGHARRSEPSARSTSRRRPSGQVRARARYRDDDGQVRRVSAVGSTQKTAERNLKEQLGNRTSRTSYNEVTPDSSFKQLVELWLDDLDLTGKLAESTRALYERNMRQLVLPVFEHYALREITVGRVDRFLKALAASKSYSTAKQAKTVLSLAFGLAVRYDALRENPVRETAKLHKPPSQAKALTIEEIEVIREAARSWRRGAGFAGPPPDGQLEQIIEVLARHVGAHRRSARDPQVRRRRHGLARRRSASAEPSCPRRASPPIASTTPRRRSRPGPFPCRPS